MSSHIFFLTCHQKILFVSSDRNKYNPERWGDLCSVTPCDIYIVATNKASLHPSLIHSKKCNESKILENVISS